MLLSIRTMRLLLVGLFLIGLVFLYVIITHQTSEKEIIGPAVALGEVSKIEDQPVNITSGEEIAVEEPDLVSDAPLEVPAQSEPAITAPSESAFTSAQPPLSFEVPESGYPTGNLSEVTETDLSETTGTDLSELTAASTEEVPPSTLESTQQPPTSAPAAENTVRTFTPAQPVPNQLVLTFAAGTSPEEQAAYIAQLNGTVIQEIEALNTVVVQVTGAFTEQNLPQSPVVAANEPDYYVTALVEPVSDPYYTQQWGLSAIGVSNGWDALPDEAPTVTVAVVDSGICADHEDLAGHILPGWDFVDNDADPQDVYGHGCGVAGIIAANINNGIGIAGIAPNVQILPLRVLNDQGVGTYSNVAAGIVRAVDDGAKVINLSLGGSTPSTVLENAVNYAASQNVLVVAAAGNTGQEGLLYPARYIPVIAVGSVDQNLERSSFSSYGPELDILAPGRDIFSLNPNGDYVTMSGTSFAAPHVTGAAVLEMAHGRTLSLDGGVLFLQPEPGLDDPTEEPDGTPPPPESPPVALTKASQEVLDEIDANGKARVIINLAMPVSLSASEAQITSAVATAQADVLASLSAQEYQSIYEYSHIPALAGTITRDGLIALQSNPSVLSIQLEYIGEYTLSQSRVLINADDVNALGITGQGARVATLDSGIDNDHPNLVDDIVDEKCFISTGGCLPPNSNGTTQGDNANDLNGHGTHVAGIITSSNASALGVAPDAGIIAIKVGDSAPSDVNVLAGLNWIIANQATLQVDVISMSLSVGASSSVVCDVSNPALAAAFTQLHNLGVAIFAASGNSGSSTLIGLPACMTHVIAVGATYDANVGASNWGICNDATTTADKIVCFSNSNSLLDILAPGATITSTWNNGGLNTISGTSMATPMAAAVAALMISKNPSLAPNDLETTLKNTGLPILDSRNGVTRSRVDALAAVNAVPAPAPLMSVDAPTQGTVLNTNSTVVSGWAVRPSAGSGNGPGVNLVRVYQGSACSGTMLGESVPNVSRPDVAAAFGLDSSYNLSGFNIAINNLPNGSVTFTTCARSSATNTFDAQVTRTITVQQVFMSVDFPAEGATLTTNSTPVMGWAVRLAGAGAGPGINLIRVYQGTACTGTMLGESVPNVSRPDVAAAFGQDSTYNLSGFNFTINGLPNGSATFTTCARSSATNTFVAQVTRTVNVVSAFMSLDFPAEGATLTTNSTPVMGWAVRLAGAGAGPGINLIRVYQGTACTGTMLGESVPNVSRPDVASAFGQDSTYNLSGFNFTISGLPNGSVTFTTCARSSATNTFVAQVTRTITVATAFMSLDFPTDGTILTTTSTPVLGWAVRLAGAGAGPGINLIRVYQGTACSGTSLGESVPNVSRPDVASAFGLDSTYNLSGFNFTISGLPNGSVTFTACARSSATNTFVAQVTRTITVATAFMSLDFPAEGTTLTTTSTPVSGWAVRLAGAGAGPGINLIRVYQGTACTGTMLGESVPNVSRPDVASAFGLDSTYNLSGFNFTISGLPNGSVTFTACARSSATNTFVAQVTRTVNVVSAFMAIDFPDNGAVVGQDSTVVTGWALQLAGAGAGPGINLVRMYQGTACTGVYYGESVLNVSRPDVASAFGLDSSYNLSGFSIPYSASGVILTYTVCARSSATNTFVAQMTRTVTVSSSSVANDNISNATVISAPYSGSQNITNATSAGNDPVFPCTGSTHFKTVWYRITPPTSMLLTVDTTGSAYDTVVAVWTGTAGSLSNVGCDDDSGPDTQSYLQVSVTAGIPYYIEVASYFTTGVGTLNLQVLLESPVVINEVFPGTPDAIEFYNRGSVPVSMTGMVFQNWNGLNAVPTTTYTFPSFTLQPGAYVTVHELAGTNTATDLYTGTNIDWVNEEGGAGLVSSGGVGMDFMRWGTDSLSTPPTGTTWITPNAAVSLSTQSMGRILNTADTNSGSDWCPQTSSLGSVNTGCVSGAVASLNTGNLSINDTNAPPTSGLIIVESTNDVVSASSDWSATDHVDASGGSYRVGSDDSMSLDFLGSTVEVTYVRQEAFGIALIEIDGQMVHMLDMNGEDFVFGQRVVITGLASGQHTIRILPYAGSMAIDSFAVEALPTTEAAPIAAAQVVEAEDTTLVQQSGSWTHYDSEAASGNAYLYSGETIQDSLRLDFVGTEISIIYVQHPALGQFAIEIDGVVQQLVDLSGGENFGEEIMLTGLGEGTHTLRIITISGVVAVDAFRVPEVIAPPLD